MPNLRGLDHSGTEKKSIDLLVHKCLRAPSDQVQNGCSHHGEGWEKLLCLFDSLTNTDAIRQSKSRLSLQVNITGIVYCQMKNTLDLLF